MKKFIVSLAVLASLFLVGNANAIGNRSVSIQKNVQRGNVRQNVQVQRIVVAQPQHIQVQRVIAQPYIQYVPQVQQVQQIQALQGCQQNLVAPVRVQVGY